MSEPVEAIRSAPGEYFLAAESVEIGTRFRFRRAVYEVVEEPRRWGAAWFAKARVVEGVKPGSEFQAMLHTGKKVEG
jgi:hypothetical protein